MWSVVPSKLVFSGFSLDFGVISGCWCVAQFINMQFILESILRLFLHLTLSFLRCVVTRGIMGLSYSRREVDALNSNIRWFPRCTWHVPLPAFLMPDWTRQHSWLQPPTGFGESYTHLMQSCFSPLLYYFFLPTKAHAALSCSVWSRCHHPDTSLLL